MNKPFENKAKRNLSEIILEHLKKSGEITCSLANTPLVESTDELYLEILEISRTFIREIHSDYLNLNLFGELKK